MTNDQLNRLFDSARTIPVETSPEEIGSWVSVAAASTTGVLGTLGKLKLLIAKKSMIMMGTLTVVTASVITAVTMGTQEPKPETKSGVTAAKQQFVEQEDSQEETLDQTVALNTQIDEEQEKPNPPLPPAPPSPMAGVTVAPLPPAPPSLLRTPRTTIRSYTPTSVQPPSSVAFVKDSTKNSMNTRSVKASGKILKKEYPVSSFSEVDIAGVFDVVLIQGSEEKVIFEADHNIQEFFEAKNEGSTLHLDFIGNVKDKHVNTVYVTFKALDKLIFSGIGDIRTEGNVKLSSFECLVSGVGDLSLDMECENLDVNFTGVGDIKLKGNGNKANYQWSGIGDLIADDLKAKDVVLLLSGVGDAKLNASESLEVKLTGLGDVHYKGSPKSTDLNTSGMGDIKGS